MMGLFFGVLCTSVHFILLYWFSVVQDKQSQTTAFRGKSIGTLFPKRRSNVIPVVEKGKVAAARLSNTEPKHFHFKYVFHYSWTFPFTNQIFVDCFPCLFFLMFYFFSSMDVQGDYDPCDASGFIRINAVRLAPLESSKICTRTLWMLRFHVYFNFSTG